MICGCDEVGRGCLAGPVVASSVVLPFPYPKIFEKIKDSKALSPTKRIYYFNQILENAISWSVIEISPKIIDKINILQASLLAMRKSIQLVYQSGIKVYVDGIFSPLPENRNIIPLIRGDMLEPAVSAASIVAKVYRDRVMSKLSYFEPRYHFHLHKGYPTKKHKEMISKYGISKYHRVTFRSER
ncbi:MAG: ribonuclease HII [Methylacidiphilales bacterium]|nr:ribonuclease HII [Candidatus Methylacidiphilales bacterium]